MHILMKHNSIFWLLTHALLLHATLFSSSSLFVLANSLAYSFSKQKEGLRLLKLLINVICMDEIASF